MNCLHKKFQQNSDRELCGCGVNELRRSMQEQFILTYQIGIVKQKVFATKKPPLKNLQQIC